MEAAYKNDAAPVDQVIWTPVHIMNRMTTNVNSWSYSDDFRVVTVRTVTVLVTFTVCTTRANAGWIGSSRTSASSVEISRMFMPPN
jgi:hypothetical protein